MKENPRVLFAKVDLSKHKIKRFPIEDVPTVYFFRKGDFASFLEYNGDEKVRSLVTFISEKTS